MAMMHTTTISLTSKARLKKHWATLYHSKCTRRTRLWLRHCRTLSNSILCAGMPTESYSLENCHSLSAVQSAFYPNWPVWTVSTSSPSLRYRPTSSSTPSSFRTVTRRKWVHAGTSASAFWGWMQTRSCSPRLISATCRPRSWSSLTCSRESGTGIWRYPPVVALQSVIF